MQTLLCRLFASGSLLLCFPAFTYAADRVVECKIPFDYNSAEVDKDFLDQCVKSLKLSSKDTLQVIGSATPQGTTAYNQALSQQRAENLRQAFKARLPGIRIQASAIGEIPHNGLLARAVAPEEAGLATTGTSGTTSSLTSASPTGGYWRVGPRVGRDRTRIEDKMQYFAPGIDIAYVPQLANPFLHAEFAVIGNTYTEVDNTRMTSFHLAPMLGYKDPGNGLVAGLRGLGGIVNSNITDSELGDAGGELRLGKETPNWTAFLGIGQTRVLQRVGVDLGYRF